MHNNSQYIVIAHSPGRLPLAQENSTGAKLDKLGLRDKLPTQATKNSLSLIALMVELRQKEEKIKKCVAGVQL